MSQQRQTLPSEPKLSQTARRISASGRRAPREVRSGRRRCGGAQHGRRARRGSATATTSASCPERGHGDRYRYRLDGELFADPASRFQPEGPFGPSQVVDPVASSGANTAWRGVDPRAVSSTSCTSGRLRPRAHGARRRSACRRLVDVGVTRARSDAGRRISRDGSGGATTASSRSRRRASTAPRTISGPFVDRAHALGLAVILDVVYNHLGPDRIGASRAFSQDYFTDRTRTSGATRSTSTARAPAPVREFCRGQRSATGSTSSTWTACASTRRRASTISSGEHILAAIVEARARGGRRAPPFCSLPRTSRRTCGWCVRCDDGGIRRSTRSWNDDFHHSAVVALTGRREAYYSRLSRARRRSSSRRRSTGYLFQGQRYAWQKQPRGTPDRRPAAARVRELHREPRPGGELRRRLAAAPVAPRRGGIVR